MNLPSNNKVDKLYETVYDWLQEYFADVQPWDDEEEIGDEAETELKRRFEKVLND